MRIFVDKIEKIYFSLPILSSPLLDDKPHMVMTMKMDHLKISHHHTAYNPQESLKRQQSYIPHNTRKWLMNDV